MKAIFALIVVVSARGNRSEPIFFTNGDRDIYCDVLAEQMRKAEVEAAIRSYVRDCKGAAITRASGRWPL